MKKENNSIIDLRRVKLPGCGRCGNREEREKNSELGICENNKSTLDELPIRCVGEWANEKIHYLLRYFDIFAIGMHRKWKSKIRYVEICSGPGRCSTRDGFEQDGTALAILNHPSFQYVEDALFIDYNETAVEALNQRIALLKMSSKAQAVLGDYNHPEALVESLKKNPFEGIALCLVDPTSCDVPFETIQILAQNAGAKTDFIISFFTNSDFRRNGADATLRAEFAEARSKYTRFLGCQSFFDQDSVRRAALSKDHNALLQLFMASYRESLKRIDKPFQDMVPIGRLYHLLFATSHERGVDFWKKAKSVEPSGQNFLPGWN